MQFFKKNQIGVDAILKFERFHFLAFGELRERIKWTMLHFLKIFAFYMKYWLNNRLVHNSGFQSTQKEYKIHLI